MNGQTDRKSTPQGSALVTGATGIIGEAVCRTAFFGMVELWHRGR